MSRITSALAAGFLLTACETPTVVETFSVEQRSEHTLTYFDTPTSFRVGDIGTAGCEIVLTCGDVGLRANDVEIVSRGGRIAQTAYLTQATSLGFSLEGAEYSIRCPTMRRQLFGTDDMDCSLRLHE